LVLIWLSVQRLRRIRRGSENPDYALPSVWGDTTELPGQARISHFGLGALAWLGALLTGDRRGGSGTALARSGLSIHSQAVLQSLASPLLLHPAEAPNGCAVMLVG